MWLRSSLYSKKKKINIYPNYLKNKTPTYDLFKMHKIYVLIIINVMLFYQTSTVCAFRQIIWWHSQNIRSWKPCDTLLYLLLLFILRLKCTKLGDVTYICIEIRALKNVCLKCFLDWIEVDKIGDIKFYPLVTFQDI